MEVKRALLAITCLFLPVGGDAAPPARLELAHPAAGHEVHLSSPALAVDRDGQPIVVWAAGGHGGNHLFLARPGATAAPVQINPSDLLVDSLHQAPGLVVGPGGEIYVSWSSSKPKPSGVLFASDLRLSRSLDGGRTFEPPLRVNEDRPTSHSFEHLAVTPDGTLLVAWIDTRGGHGSTATWLARVTERGSRVEGVTRLEAGETCVCCRVSVSAGPGPQAAVMWRKVFPGDVRDMVLSTSADGGRSFDAASLVHADRWRIAACPHRGGTVATDARGRRYALWYTERRERPEILLAVAADGRRFAAPRLVHTAAGSVPDHARLAVGGDGRGVVVWEDSTAVRRRILLRTIRDGGRTLGPVRVLSQAIKAWSPDVVAAGDDFVVAWHEERFPTTVTVVERLSPKEER
jgi:hypothetical protein